MPLEAADLAAMFGLSPADAVKFVESKGYKLTWNWFDMLNAAHAKALTIAKVTRVDILQDFAAAIADNLQTGDTGSDFARRMAPILQDKGWWGKQVVVDSTGGAQMVQLGSPQRLDTIYRTNTQSAYMAGRYTQMWAARDSHPWWQYVAILDDRTRPTHRVLAGLVFAATDPVWDFIYPPNGYNCRCRVRPLSDVDLKAENIDPLSSKGRLVDVPFSAKAPLLDKRTGEVIRPVRQGIRVPGRDGKDVIFAPDIGFGGNPGKDWMRPFTPPPLDTLPTTFDPGQMLPALPTPTQVSAARLLPDSLSPEDYARAFLLEFGADLGKPALFVDAGGAAIPISEDLFQDTTGAWKSTKDGRGPYMLLLADALRAPDEIWLRWEESRDNPGTWLLKRRYILSFELRSNTGGDTQYGLTVYEMGKDGWSGSTAMMAKPDRGPEARLRYIAQQRDGFLLYLK